MYPYPKRLVPFVLEEYKREHINYLEVIIDKEGNVYKASPSHQIALLILAALKEEKSLEQISYECPPEWYTDFDTWLQLKTGSISVWLNFYRGSANQLQITKLKELKKEGLYKGDFTQGESEIVF